MQRIWQRGSRFARLEIAASSPAIGFMDDAPSAAKRAASPASSPPIPRRAREEATFLPPRAGGSGWALEVARFDGEAQKVEATAPTQDLGGTTGLTVVGWVRRANQGSAFDRIIDFGNDAPSKGNIVINFQGGLSYESHDDVGGKQLITASLKGPAHPRAVAAAAASVAADPSSSSSSSSSPTGPTFPAQQWTHVAVTHGADGTASIFVNGMLSAKGAVALPQLRARSHCLVGRSHWTHDPHFVGEMRDVMVFGYALSRAELRRAALSRTLPSGPGRAAPLLSIASSWREVRGSGAPTVSLAGAGGRRAPPARACANCAARGFAVCGCLLGGGGGGLGRDGAGSAALQFITTLDGAQGADAVLQLRTAYPAHSAQVTALEAALAAMPTPTAAAEQRLLTARDARRRAATVERVVAHAEAMPAVQRDRASGQLVSPPRISAAVDPERGVYHAFAIYELRTAAGGGVEGPWHVFVSDVFNMRQLLPQQDSWLPNVASLLLSVLRRKSGAGQELVALKALEDDPQLTSYYEEIGFTNEYSAFADAGLEASYRSGELLLA